MVSIEMERWRIFFEKSGEDLWTVIDWALTIAAVNYPQELRARRDGFAEKLFAPAHYPLVAARSCGGGALPAQNVRVESGGAGAGGDGGDFSYMDSEAPVPEDAVPGPEVGFGGQQIREEISGIGHCLQGLSDSSPEEEFLKPLERLEQMKVSVEDLRITLIGKVVNGLRKHPSMRVKKAAKKLVKMWKDVADEWAKSMGEAAQSVGDEAQLEEGELMGDDQSIKIEPRMELLSSVSSVTQPNDGTFGCSPDDGRTEFLRKLPLASFPSERSSKLNAYRIGSSSARRPPPKPQSPDCDKLEAAKKKLHEGYQQAANVKRQRTIQLMGPDQVPQPGSTTKAGASGNNNSRKGGSGQMKL